MRTARALALAATVTVPVVALADKPPRPDLQLKVDPYNIDMRDYSFPSGLRIIFQEDHNQPIVSITSVIDRGSSHDPPGIEGVAHLCEHMWFQSIHGEGMPNVWDYLKEIGANLNASTAQDWTNYMTVAPADQLLPLLVLEGNRLSEPVIKVTNEDVLEEREVVRNELRMRYENTGGAFLFFLWGKLYPQGHPYSRTGIGTHNSLDNITLKDVQDFTAKNYRPENATIVVVGDFELDKTWEYIAQSFPKELLVDPNNPDGEFALVDPPVRVQGPAEEPPPPADQTVSYHKGGVDKTTAVVAWSLPGAYRPNTALMETTVGMLNYFLYPYIDPDWNPLTDSLDDQKGFGCFFWGGEVNSQAICTVEVNAKEDPEEVAEDLMDGLYSLWDVNNRPFQQMIYGRSIKDRQAAIFRSVELVSAVGSGRATDTAEFTHFTGDPMYFSRQFEWLNTMTVDESVRFAQKYLNRDRAVVVVIEPYEDEDIDVTSSNAAYRGAVRSEEKVTLLDLDEVNEELLEGIMAPPDLAGIKEFTLDNGLDVVLYPYGSAPIARAHIVFDGGHWVEPVNGLTMTADRYMSTVFNTVTGTDFNVLDPLNIAAQWQINFGGATQQSIGIVGSSANLDGMLYLLREFVETAEVDPGNKRNTVKVQKKAVQRNRAKSPDWWADYLVGNNLVPDHEYSEVQDEAWWDSYAQVSSAQGEEWLHELIQPANGTLYIIGRLDPTQAEEYAKTYFGGWEAQTTKVEHMQLPAAPPEPKAGRKVYVLNAELQSQTDVTYTCQIGPATVENYETREMLADVLGEEAWVILREQSGVTYGAGAYQADYAGGTSLLRMNSLVQNDAAGLAVETFLSLSDKAAAGELSEERLTLMKLAAARNYALGQQTSGQMFNRLNEPYREGWSHIEGRVQRLADVTVEDLAAQMERCHGNEVITLIGPEEVILPQLDEIGVEYINFDFKAEGDKMWEAYDPKGYAKAKKKEAKQKAKEEEESAG